MRKIFFKKIFVSLALLTILAVISAGCGTTAPPIGPVGPTTYTVTIISQDSLCYGTVYVNGLPTSSYLLTWGSATVYNVPSGAAIYLVDTAGFISHTEIFNPLFGTTIIFNSWW